MRRLFTVFSLCVVVLAAVVTVMPAAADVNPGGQWYSFSYINCFWENGWVEEVGEKQFFVYVEPRDNGNKVRFNFHNTGPYQSDITHIYFDDGTLLRLDEIFDDPDNGVDFIRFTVPFDLPWGECPGINFDVTKDYRAMANIPQYYWGIRSGRMVGY